MITGVVIARNEEKNLPACLSSLKFCSHILVIDNHSADRTASVAKKFGAAVVKSNSSGDFALLRNTALEHVTTAWTLFIDSDERVSDQLASEIKAAVDHPDVSGYYLLRRDHLWGRVLRFGDVGNVRLLRLGRTNSGKWLGHVHETWHVTGQTSILNSPLDHFPHPDLSAFMSSLDHYSGIRAGELYRQGTRSDLFSIVFYPLSKFLYLWILRLGFLDGTAGLVHAVSMSFYSFLVRAKLYLLARGISDSQLR